MGKQSQKQPGLFCLEKQFFKPEVWDSSCSSVYKSDVLGILGARSAPVTVNVLKQERSSRGSM
jgi:hypothetical protein